MYDISKTDPRYLALASPEVVWIVLIEIEFPTGTMNLTTAQAEVTIGGTTYNPESDLIQISPFEITSDQTDESYTLLFEDPYREGQTRWIDRFTPNYTGIPLTVKMAFLYEMNWTDSITLYKGTCVSIGSQLQRGSVVTAVQFAGPLARLDDSDPLFLSRAHQRGLNPTDTFLDQVHLAKNIQWGRKVGNDG